MSNIAVIINVIRQPKWYGMRVFHQICVCLFLIGFKEELPIAFYIMKLNRY